MAERLEHITIQNETYDIIALNYYEDEKYAGIIAQSNPEYADVIVFDASIKLIIPILTVAHPESPAPWRRK